MTRRLMSGSLTAGPWCVRPAQLPHPGAAARQLSLTRRGGADQQRLLDLLRLKLDLQRLDADCELGLVRIESDALELAGYVGDLVRDAFGAFLLPAQRAHEDVSPRGEGV